MRPFSVLAALSLASMGWAQVVQYDGGSNYVNVADTAATYTADQSFTYLDLQSVEEGITLGTSIQAMTAPWTATFANGSASGTGEQAYSDGYFADNGSVATLTSVLSANAQLATTVTGFGPYYGVEGSSLAIARSTLEFTTTQATTVSVIGSLSDFGLSGGGTVAIIDETTGIQTILFHEGAGSFAINASTDLVAGDSYELYDNIGYGTEFQYDPFQSISMVDAEGGSAYVIARLTPTPAPEPLSCGLLGLGAAAILRRRKQ